MKIKCDCGHLINDSTDFLSHKGHLIADQDWFNLLNSIDAAIEGTKPTPADKEAACMRIRSLVSKITRLVYQCSNCGTVFINNSDGELNGYQPLSPLVSKEILKGADS